MIDKLEIFLAFIEYRRALFQNQHDCSQCPRIPLPQAALQLEDCLKSFITFFQDGVERHRWLLERDLSDAVCSELLKHSSSPSLR